MSRETRIYHVLPMAYMAGFLNTLIAPLMAGAQVVEGERFGPSNSAKFWERPLSLGVNTLSLVPSIGRSLLFFTRSPEIIASIRERIHTVHCTSAPIPPRLRRDFLAKFGCPLQNCYGMTELGGPLTFQRRSDAERCMDNSTPIAGVTLEIREDQGLPRLWVRSPYRMLGYLESDHLHSIADTRGFTNTGDLAALSELDELEVLGRDKDIILKGGTNIAAKTVETAASSVPGVEEAAAVGIPNEYWGETICLFIVSTAADTDTKKQLKRTVLEHCRNKLGSIEVPDSVIFISALPRSFIGKILKDELRALATNQSDPKGTR